jgi:hypothetical protein
MMPVNGYFLHLMAPKPGKAAAKDGGGMMA